MSEKNLMPTGTSTDLEAVQTAYYATTAKLLKDEDWQTIPGQHGRRFLKRSGWRKLATAYGISITIESVEIQRNEQGQVLAAQVLARAVHDGTGRTMDGFGACSAEERRFSKREHDIPAVAETRAKNRALADLFGLGEVTLEEMEADLPVATDEERQDLTQAMVAIGVERQEQLRKWWKEHGIPPLTSPNLKSYHIDQINDWIGVLVDVVEKEQA